MSDNIYIPFEIQLEIIKMLPVRSLIQFRSVSKAWKNLIDSSDFIADYNTQAQHLLVTYDDPVDCEPKYVSIADDDTFPQQKVSPTVPLLANTLKHSVIIGSSHGLFCLYSDYLKDTVVLWNLSIRKAVAVVVPNVGYDIYETVVGFGVCRETYDPKIVKIVYIENESDMERISSIPWQVEVFTLSTGAWRGPYSSNLPRKSIYFDSYSEIIDGIVYWLAVDRSIIDGALMHYNLIISFDMTSEEFKEVKLPDSLAHLNYCYLSISKLREVFVVIAYYLEDTGVSVWMMQDSVPKSFTRLYSVYTPYAFIMGFRKSGEPIIKIKKYHHRWPNGSSLVVYESCSEHITILEINAFAQSLCVYPYIETLLLLDQPDFIIYDKGKH